MPHKPCISKFFLNILDAVLNIPQHNSQVSKSETEKIGSFLEVNSKNYFEKKQTKNNLQFESTIY